MTLLSRKADYALLILSFLDHHPEGGSAHKIAAQFGLSKSFVANILKVLCGKGFVVSHRGVKGGYVLQRPAERIRLTELLDCMEEDIRVTECNKAEPQDSCALLDTCPLRQPIAELHQRIRQLLSTVTLDQLFRPPSAVPTQVGLLVGTLASRPLMAH